MANKNKGFNYFECLVSMSEHALKEAKLLHEGLSDFKAEKLEALRHDIHEIEHNCDLVKHTLTTALVKDFLPPIDREDLFSLSHVTDNLTDSVESIVTFFYMANITALRDDTAAFTSLIIECCETTVELLKEFHNFKKSETLHDLIVKLNDLEEQGDRLYIESVRRLSCDETDTRAVIEWRDVYRNFEVCFDAAESIADNVESVVMKNT